MRIRTRLALMFLALTITPLILLGFVIYAQTYDIARQQVFRVLENSATNLKWRIELVSEHYLDSFASLVDRAQLRQSLGAYEQRKDEGQLTMMRELVEDSAHALRVFKQVDVYTDDGELLFSTPERDRAPRRPDFERLRAPGASIPLILFHRLNQRDARMEIASPVVRDNRRLGYVIAEVDLMPLKKLCERPLGIGQTEDIILVTNTEAGVPAFVVPPKLFRSEPPLDETLQISQPRLPTAREEATFEAMWDYRGKPVVAVTRPIDTVKWNLLVKVDQEEAFAPLVAIRTFIFGSSSLLLLLVVALARMVAGSFTAPILELAEMAKRLREGRLQTRVRVHGGGVEIAETCAAFNQMAEQLQYSHSLLTEQIRSLAEKENHTRAILDSCLDAVVCVDDANTVIEWNPAAEVIFGFGRQAAIGHNLFELIVPPQQKLLFCEAFRTCTPSIDPLTVGMRFESFAKRADGSEFPVELMMSSVFVREKPLLTAFIRDLSEEKETRGQTQLLSSILRNSEDAIIGEDLNRVIRVWNQAATRMFGWDASEVIGRPIGEILPTDRQAEERQIAELLELERPISMLETTRTRKDGTIIHLSLSISHIRDGEGNIVGISKIARDITDKKRAENFMKASLREKELLLKEVHHRVKNNMQVISSLLKLQSEYLRDDGARQLFKQSDERIRSMAIVHERLYRAEALTEIDLAEYIKELANYLFRSYSMNPENISVHMNLMPVQLGIDQAIPCGLLLNECISNVFKHAFSPGRPGQLSIVLSDSEGHIQLSVSDNGRGLPEDFDIERPTSLGFEIIRTLTQQLEGTLDVRKGNGTEFVFRFLRISQQHQQQRQQRRWEHGNSQHISM